jgi:hypothetical protein
LINLSIAKIEEQYDIGIVLLRKTSEQPDFHPAAERIIETTDTLAILGGAAQISALAQDQF